LGREDPCSMVTWVKGTAYGFMHVSCRRSSVVARQLMSHGPRKEAAAPAGGLRPKALRAAGMGGLDRVMSPHLDVGGGAKTAPESARVLFGAEVGGSREARSSSTPPRVERARGPNTRKAQQHEMVSEQRLQGCMECMDGQCEARAKGIPYDMLCVGCHERPDCDGGAHSVCWDFTAGQAAHNIYRCILCRLEELSLLPDADPADVERLRQHLLISTVRDHNVTAAGTDKVIKNVRRLAEECTMKTSVRDHFSSAAGLKYFGEWLERTDRAGSVDLSLRIGAQLGRNDDPSIKEDLCKDKTIKRFLKGLKGRLGDDDTGDTARLCR
jgi:hypothetical protein